MSCKGLLYEINIFFYFIHSMSCFHPMSCFLKHPGWLKTVNKFDSIRI